jgi:hypothetical protein
MNHVLTAGQRVDCFSVFVEAQELWAAEEKFDLLEEFPLSVENSLGLSSHCSNKQQDENHDIHF